MGRDLSNLKYLVVGAGGTGGATGAHLARGGHDVTLIVRGKHLEAIRENGLRVIRPHDEFTVRPAAYTSEEYAALTVSPDVIFVCVKGYSIDSIIPFIAEISNPDTIVIPILNIYGTGGRMQEQLPDTLVTDGCIYIAAEISAPGTILMNGDILRIVYGLRREQREAFGDAGESPETATAPLHAPADLGAVLEQIKADLSSSDILGIFSDNIERDALRKFSYVSPQGACGLYYGIPAGPMQRPGEERDCFAGLVHEIELIAHSMSIDFEADMVDNNLKILDTLDPAMTTSLQRDIAAGKTSELDGLIYEVIRMGERCGVDLPVYTKIVDELRSREAAGTLH